VILHVRRIAFLDADVEDEIAALAANGFDAGGDNVVDLFDTLLGVDAGGEPITGVDVQCTANLLGRDFACAVDFDQSDARGEVVRGIQGECERGANSKKT
jgi:hypothetical protein